MLAAACCERIATRLESGGDYQVLRRVDLDRRHSTGKGDAQTRIGIAVDVETTGTDVARDAIIELSCRRFRYTGDGVIVAFDRPYSWLEDPGRPLDPAISALTGLSDADLSGRTIDEATAVTLLASADVRIAFNAGFDCKFVQRRLSALAGLPWACAMREVDWQGRGFDGSGRSLGWILAQCGYFNGKAHRAAGDVDALIATLEHRSSTHGTALREMLDTAGRPTWRVEAVGAHFDARLALKKRGYRWDPEETVWYREVQEVDRATEQAWLAENVYTPGMRPRLDGPHLQEITWCERHA